MVDVCEEAAELVARVAALDAGKKELVACVRVPREDKPGRRRQEVRAFATTTRLTSPPAEPGSAALRRVLPRPTLSTDFRFSAQVSGLR